MIPGAQSVFTLGVCGDWFVRLGKSCILAVVFYRHEARGTPV